MARFAAYDARGVDGYLLDVQSDMLDHLSSRMVIPLMPLDVAPPRLQRLNPAFEIGDVTYSLVTEYMAAVPKGYLRTYVADLSAEADQITAAVDFLMQGF